MAEPFSWQDLEVTPDDARCAVRDSDGLVVDGLGVAFDEPWQAEPARTRVEEWEQIWHHPSGARARVRWSWDTTVSLRVDLTTPGELDVAPPRLVGQWQWPPQVHLAGALAWLAWQRADGRVMRLAQVRGDAREASTSQDGWPLTQPGRLPAGDHLLVIWRGEVCDDWREVASRLPQWWPESTHLVAGSEIFVDLPDAAVTCDGEGVPVHDEGALLVAEEGRTEHQVHHGHGTTVLALWGASGLAELVEQRAFQLSDSDPRQLSAGSLLVVQQGSGLDLRDACEWALRRPTPLAVVVAARELVRHPDPDLAEALVDAAGRLAVAPGSELARLEASMAVGQVLGGGVAGTPVGVDAALVALERSLLLGRPDAHARRVASWLGAGLPGCPVLDARQRAVLVALTGWWPEDAGDLPGWPVPLSVAREQASRRLLAEGADDETLAWLVLGAVG